MRDCYYKLGGVLAAKYSCYPTGSVNNLWKCASTDTLSNSMPFLPWQCRLFNSEVVVSVYWRSNQCHLLTTPSCNQEYISPSLVWAVLYLSLTRLWLWAEGPQTWWCWKLDPTVGRWRKTELCEDICYKVDQWLIPHCHHFSAALIQFHKAGQLQGKGDPNGNVLGPFCELWHWGSVSSFLCNQARQLPTNSVFFLLAWGQAQSKYSMHVY